MSILPRARPGIGIADARARLIAAGALPTTALLGVRGYYRDTMGVPGQNDIGIYDDAIVLVTPAGFLAVNANTDPSKHAPRMATLDVGVWRYQLGMHHHDTPQAYPALVQAGPVRVLREGATPAAARVPDTGWFGINIHRGGDGGTSSLGCQTVHPSQWPEFYAAVRAAIVAARLTTIEYALTVAP